MASPIRWFRKHAQFFIVIFGVVLMAIFGLGTVFTSLNPADFVSTGEEDTNKVVAQWSGGELRKDDLFLLRQKHFAARRLLSHVYQFAVKENGGKTFPVAVPQILPLAPPNADVTVEQMDQQMLNRFLFAKKAEQEGFIVDENMAIDYIAQYGGDVPLSKNMLRQLNRQVNQNVPLTAIVRHIQTELLSQQMESLARGGLPFDDFNPVSAAAINPTEAIQLYARSNKQIECQVLPISVEEYVSKVSEEPTDTELKALYDEGKYDYPYGNFERPGFKKFKQARIQYFVGELETFLTNEIAKLPDAEVQAEYDKLVAADDDFVMEVIPQKAEEDPAAADSEGEEQSTESDDPAPAPGDETDAGEGADSGTDQATESNDGDADSEGPDTDSATGDSDAGDDNAADDESGEEKTNTVLKKQDEEPEGDDESKTQDAPENDLRNDNQEESEEGTESDETTQEESAAEGDQPSEDNSADEANSDAASSEEESPASDTGSEAGEETNDETGDQDEAGNDPTMEEKPKVERRPKPLADIAEELKRRMCMEAARIARDEAMDGSEKAIRKFQMKRSKWEYEQQRNGEEVKELDPPDFSKIADEFQLQFMETGLINQTEIGDERIGQITTFAFVNQRLIQNNVGEQIFYQYEDTPLYQPTTVDDGANRAKVIYWLAEKVDQNVPDFKTAREDIVKFWKRQKGVEAAQAEAQKIVDQLKNSDGKLLKEIFPEKAQDTGAFSWFSSFGRFTYGQPASVEVPGEEFMSKAFSLDTKEAGHALNEPRDTVYVIQNTSTYQKSLEQLGSEYINNNFFQSKRIPTEVVSAKGEYRRRLNFDWLKELQEDMKVDIVGQ